MSAPTILIAHEGDGAAQHQQRCVTPAQGLRRLGHRVYTSAFTMHGDVITAPRCDDDKVMQLMLEAQQANTVPQIPALKPPPDVVLLRLLDADRFGEAGDEGESIRAARSSGQLVLFDLDDDVWGLPEWNPARLWRKRAGVYLEQNRDAQAKRDAVIARAGPPRAIDLDVIEGNIAACDATIASTPGVARAVEEHVPGARVFVCRNGVDALPYYWPRRVLEHPKLRVAWMGQAPGANGLQDVLPALAALLEEFGCEFWHLGASPGDPPPREWLPAGWSVPVRSVPWAKQKVLPWVLSEIDVGVIARRSHSFHEAQSNVSGLAYAAAGVPFVASRTEEYAAIEREGIGTTFEHPDLEPALRRLLDSQPARDALRIKGRQQVVRLHDPVTVARQYVAAFEEARRAPSSH